jgi:glycine cleavage system H protein
VCGEIESTKSVSEIYSPVTGTVVEINQDAVDEPGLVNTDPYGRGWLLRVEVVATGPLLSAQEYADLTGS